MPFWVRDAGTWKQVTAPSVRDAGVWKAVKEGWVRDAGVWKKFFELVGFSVAIDPPGWIALYPNGTNASQAFSAVVTGGSPGYTYQWSLSGAGFSFVGGTTSSSCTVECTGNNTTLFGTLTLTVTDSTSATASSSASLTVEFGQ